jgi:hypothetical protein
MKKLKRGWIGVLVYALIVVGFMASLVGFYLAAMWQH